MDVQFKKINGYLHKIKILKDNKGNILEHIITPLKIEVRPRDALQVIVGASILAIPVGMTEETWNLGNKLPLLNVILLTLMGLAFIAMFVYFNYYREVIKSNKLNFIKRILMIYILSLLLVAVFLLIIDKFPWNESPLIAVKRLLIITFPCSLSATISDVIK